MMRTKLTQAFGVSLLVSGLALSFSASAAEGLYSAEGLLDADVYDKNGEEIGEVQDVLMGDNMSVHSLVLETDGVLGMGGKKIVVERGKFTVSLEEPDGQWNDVDYEVHVQANQKQIKNFEVYDEGWWNETQQAAAAAWEETSEGAANAWESTKQATNSAWQSTQDAAENVTDEAEDEADSW